MKGTAVPEFHTETRLAKALAQLLSKLEAHLQLDRPLAMYLAGGMAVHLYTGERVTTDIDAEYGMRVAIPADLVIEVDLEDGRHETVYFDTNYNASFALMHEDHVVDALPVNLPDAGSKLKLFVLSPVDLAVSKIARFAEHDRADIEALVERGLVTADAMQERAHQALSGFVGNVSFLKLNIRDAVALARAAEQRCNTPHPERPRLA